MREDAFYMLPGDFGEIYITLDPNLTGGEEERLIVFVEALEMDDANQIKLRVCQGQEARQRAAEATVRRSSWRYSWRYKLNRPGEQR